METPHIFSATNVQIDLETFPAFRDAGERFVLWKGETGILDVVEATVEFMGDNRRVVM